MTESTPAVLFERVDLNIVKITLNRPRSLNALNVDLVDGLVQALTKAAGATVIILEGAGDRAFCAGQDLKETLAPKTSSGKELRIALEQLQDVARLTSSAASIVICAVSGWAVGGGAEIALGSDFIIDSPTAKYKFPEVTLGYASTGGIMLRLPLLVGLLKAKELLITGKVVGAEEALKIGMLSEIVNDPKKRAMELALQIAKLPQISLSTSKQTLERATFPNMEAVLADEVNVASYCFSQVEAADSFDNFVARKGKQNTTTPIHDLNSALASAVQKSPDKPFLRFCGKDTTFSEFDRLVGSLAAGFQSLGVIAGAKVVVMQRNCPEMVHTWFAANRLGAVYVPINSELKGLTLKHVLAAAEATIAIVDQEFYQDIMSTGVLAETSIYVDRGTHAPSLQSLYLQDTELLLPVSVSPSTIAAMLYTSGSTGRSKPCILTHQFFTNQARSLIKVLSITNSDVLYCPFPLFHVDATALTVVPALLTGGVAALSVRYSASKFWDEIRETKSTIYDFMGATLTITYKQPPSDQDRNHSVRAAWGVPVPAWAADYEARFGHRIIELYGSVEAGLPVIQQGERVPGSCGRALPGYTVIIADENDVPIPTGQIGNILIRSDTPNAFFNGYYKCPEVTINTNRNLWLHTGDLGKLDEHGNLFFVGRTKYVIRRRGENVSAFEVEEEFERHPDVVTAAAFAIPSELGLGTESDIKVSAVIRDAALQDGLDERALWDWSRKNMAKFQVPSVIEFVQELKKTPTGKVEKGGLAKAGGQRFDMRASSEQLSREFRPVLN